MAKSLITKSVLLLLAALSAGIAESSVKRPGIVVDTRFPNTENELKIYRNYGRTDGSTILVIGGIQGDEPGGYLSADLYSELPLEKGNLIVVPRANFQSIITNRRAMEKDMNRLFNQDKAAQTAEDSIVVIISGLMGEADLFLNLHDGYGFYRDKWIDAKHNPHRFGQSLIADVDVYNYKGRTIDLKGIAGSILQNVNKKIPNPEYQIHFMNTHSFDPQSEFREMINSGTYNALVNYGIPAFGIESSKDLPSVEEKILYHNLVINEFMALYDILPEIPGIKEETVNLLFCHISINGQKPEIIYPGDRIKLKRGDRLSVRHISAGTTENGLSCDILGIGSYQDYGKDLTVSNSTEILFRKDARTIGKVFVDVETPPIRKSLISYVLKRNGEWIKLSDGDTLRLGPRDSFSIEDVNSPDFRADEITVNVKGWVPKGSYNDGEDRHFSVPASDLIWKKYSLHGDGRMYPVVVTLNNTEISRIIILVQR